MSEDPKNKRLYLSPPHLSGRELEFINDAVESNWIAPLGPHVDLFEKEFIEWFGSGSALAVSTGTAALHLILRLLGVERDDEVICSSFTFCASATPIVYQGAHPVFIDSELASWNMDPDLLEEELKTCAKRGKLPKAVIVVHLYGQSADLDRILKCCSEYSIPVIEDAAEALGARYKGKKVGNLAHTGFFSFNGNKLITTSSGGMLISMDDTVISKARFLATQARDPAPHYQHSEIGYNYRMSNILAAIGRAQFRVLEERVQQARNVYQQYHHQLSDLPGIDFMPEPEWSQGNRWLTCITIDPRSSSTNREDIRILLEKHNIESRPLWKPLHMQPVFSDCRIRGGIVSEALFENGLCLPSGTAMTPSDINRVCELITSRFNPK